MWFLECSRNVFGCDNHNDFLYLFKIINQKHRGSNSEIIIFMYTAKVLNISIIFDQYNC